MKNLIYLLAFIAGLILGFLLCRKGCGEPNAFFPPFVEGERPIPQMIIAWPDGLKIIPVDKATSLKYDEARITVIHFDGIQKDTITKQLVVNKAQITTSAEITIPIKAWDKSVYEVQIQYIKDGNVVDYTNNRIADTIGWETVDVGVTSNKDPELCKLDCISIYSGDNATHTKAFPALSENCYLQLQIGTDRHLLNLYGKELNYLNNCSGGDSLTVQGNNLVAKSGDTLLYSISMMYSGAQSLGSAVYRININGSADYQKVSLSACCK